MNGIPDRVVELANLYEKAKVTQSAKWQKAWSNIPMSDSIDLKETVVRSVIWQGNVVLRMDREREGRSFEIPPGVQMVELAGALAWAVTEIERLIRVSAASPP